MRGATLLASCSEYPTILTHLLESIIATFRHRLTVKHWPTNFADPLNQKAQKMGVWPWMAVCQSKVTLQVKWGSTNVSYQTSSYECVTTHHSGTGFFPIVTPQSQPYFSISLNCLSSLNGI